MGSRWRKLKLAVGLNLCVYAPDGDSLPPNNVETRLSNASSPPCNGVSSSPSSVGAIHPPTTPIPSSSGLLLFKSGSKSLFKSSKGICAICLTTIKPGHGHAIFTAECSHSFHFHCITSNVKHGSQICPVCRAKWKEVPFQNPPTSTFSLGMSRINQANAVPYDALMNVGRGLRSPPADVNRRSSSSHHTSEPARFDDDEALCQQHFHTQNREDADYSNTSMMEINLYPEIYAVPRSVSQDNFVVLVHLKAPTVIQRNRTISSQMVPHFRAPVDLVTVLDISGSMSGTKLALLKRAMSFVIQNLGPSDRLSVIAFSSTARRIFPLKRMTDTGRQEALHSINSLVSNGGTNIAEGLRKGAKVFVDRKDKNPVGSIILLSDGQDTYTVNGSTGVRSGLDYRTLVPILGYHNHGGSLHIPVHVFGLGADHDAISMHSISEMSGGTFSFIETEGVIQDAIAQCLGGLLSVVVRELKVKVESAHPGLVIGSVKAGNYRTDIMSSREVASVDIGDLYAEEERDFLVTVNIPIDESANQLPLLRVSCVHRHPVTKEIVSSDGISEVKIQRPNTCEKQSVSMEVDRQRNRLRAAEVMSESRFAAEHGDLSGAVSILSSYHKSLLDTPSAQAGDLLCQSLCAELKEMQERMGNRHIYEESGRAYVLSGLSSHSWQRATARHDATSSTSLVQSYQTPSMVDMVNRSQTMSTSFGCPSSHKRSLQPLKTFPSGSRKARP